MPPNYQNRSGHAATCLFTPIPALKARGTRPFTHAHRRDTLQDAFTLVLSQKESLLDSVSDCSPLQ